VDYEQFILVFTSIIYEALPFVVLGVVIAGFLEEFVPQQFIARLIPRSRVLAIGLGGLLGIIFPMCECGIIPVMRRLLRKGLPLSVCVCYMLAGPVINVVVMLSTYVAFNPPFPPYVFDGPGNVVLIRAGLAFLVAFNTALLVEWQFRKHGLNLLSPRVVEGLNTDAARADEAEPPPPSTLMQRLNNISETALHDFVDIMAFLILGAFLAAMGRGLIEQTIREQSAFGAQAQPAAAQQGPVQKVIREVIDSPPAVKILAMMVFAVLFCLCSEADAFVAANFHPLWPPAAKIAFLVLGPMLDIKLYLMYTRVFRPRLIWTIMLSVAVQVFCYTLLVHYLWPDVPPWVRYLFTGS
jgi:uncharacterized membrane protein YraQ (UPF0718 family)